MSWIKKKRQCMALLKALYMFCMPAFRPENPSLKPHPVQTSSIYLLVCKTKNWQVFLDKPEN
jgi:hypothetical protein